MSVTDSDGFNVLQFEKKLTALKDSQESINNCCQWCLNNRQHHKKIVISWLNVLKRVKVEHRLILFYLANDVIQYSKRRKYEYVESWGTALQKATTLVRDDRVKQKILRIFKIWEDRGVYNEEFIADLCGLISVTPTAPKNDEPHEFQASYVINKIRVCSNLETDTDMKLKKLKELNPKIIETDSYYSSLKDRAHLDDTEKELDTYAKYMEDYINALRAEVKNRITLISVLKQAEGQLDTDRKDVKIVANAYKSFGTRVKTVHKKLDELKLTLQSPIPSPDINAPSPNSDSDIDLPDGQASNVTQAAQETSTVQKEVDLASVQITNANYYNPVPPPTTDPSSQFVANGFTSFIGSSLPFNVQSFNAANIFSTNSSVTNPQTTNSSFDSLSSTLNQPPPPPKTDAYSYTADLHSSPLLPPPMPPFGGKEDANFGTSASYETTYENETVPDYGPPSFNSNASYSNETSYAPTYGPTSGDSGYDPLSTLFPSDGVFEPPIGANPYPPSEEYNPEEELQIWEGDVSWTQPPPLDSTDTPESPPPFEKEAYGDPIEYHDNTAISGAADVDHRVIPTNNFSASEKIKSRGQDVDHRNLISLIGSPATDSNSNQLSNNDVWSSSDQDYRSSTNSTFPAKSGDQDYRLPFDIEEQLKLPPPPPPPPSSNPCLIPVVQSINHLKKNASTNPQDNVESIDMDLSDDDIVDGKESSVHQMQRENLKVVIDGCGPLSTGSNSNVNSIHSPEEFSSQPTSQDGMDKFSLMEAESMAPTSIGPMLQPPPPLPELPDDAEENLFLDQMNNDLNDFLLNHEDLEENLGESFWSNSSQPPSEMPNSQLQPPPMFSNMTSLPPPIIPPSNWMGDNTHSPFQSPPFHNELEGGRDLSNKRCKYMSNLSTRGIRGTRGGFVNDHRGGFHDHREGFNNSRGGFNTSRGGYNENRGRFNDTRIEFNDNRNEYSDNRDELMDNRGGFNDIRGGFNNARSGFNDIRGSYNDGHFTHRGPANNFRVRGRGNTRLPRGNFRGNFRGNRGNF